MLQLAASAEVDDLDLVDVSSTRLQQDVLRFDVSVHDAVVVEVLGAGEQLSNDQGRVLLVETASLLYLIE